MKLYLERDQQRATHPHTYIYVRINYAPFTISLAFSLYDERENVLRADSSPRGSRRKQGLRFESDLTGRLVTIEIGEPCSFRTEPNEKEDRNDNFKLTKRWESGTEINNY